MPSRNKSMNQRRAHRKLYPPAISGDGCEHMSWLVFVFQDQERSFHHLRREQGNNLITLPYQVSAARNALWTCSAGIVVPPYCKSRLAQASSATMMSKPKSTAARA